MVRHLNIATKDKTAGENIDASGPVTELRDDRGRAIASNWDNGAFRSCLDDLVIDGPMQVVLSTYPTCLFGTRK